MAPVRGPLPSRSGMLAIVTLIGALAGRHPAAAFVPFPSRVAPQAPVRLGRVGSIQERPARLLPAALAPRGARSLRPMCTAVATATDSQASHSVSSTAIIGGGPSGLATAIMLAQKKHLRRHHLRRRSRSLLQEGRHLIHAKLIKRINFKTMFEVLGPL